MRLRATPAVPALALVSCVAVLLAAVPAAAQTPAVVRIGATGQTPAGFSLELSRATFDDAPGDGSGQAATTAVWGVVGRDDVFADSLASGPLLAGAALAYVPGGAAGTVDSATATELQRVLDPGSTVYIAGGEAAVAPAVETGLRDLGFIPIRLGGVERVDTSVRIAREAVRLAGAPDRILVASSASFPDAVAGGALAADGVDPLVLTDPLLLSETTSAFLDTYGDAAEVVVLGGTAAISDAVFAASGADRRVGGETRAHTAALLAELWPDDVTGAAVIEGFAPDAWREGTAGATVLQPVLLAGPGSDVVNQPTLDALAGRTGPRVVLGGTDRLSRAAADVVAGAR